MSTLADRRANGHASWTTGGVVVILLCMLTLVVIGCGASTEQERRDDDPRGTSLLGEAQQVYRSGAYAQTIQLIDSAATYIPDLPDLWFLRGLVLADLYRFDESDASFEKTLELDPNYRSVRFNMGHNAFHQSMYFTKDAYREALRHYRDEERLLRTIAEDGDVYDGDPRALAAVLLQIGTTYWNLDVADSAAHAYKQAIEVDSSTATAHAWLAGLQQESGDLEAALKSARRASATDPDNAEHRLLVGVLLRELGEFDEAVPHLEEAAQQAPWNRTAIYNLGQALLETGRTEDGKSFLSRADSLEELRSDIERSHVHIFQKPDDPIRWENYAFLLQQAGRLAEAREAIGVMHYLVQSDSSSR